MADQADSPGASPMRGRAAEYDAVLSLLASTAEGQGKVLLVEGDPGTGKSLLLTAAAREARARGFSLVTVVADELSQATPLAPLLSAIHATPTAAPSLATVFTRLEAIAAACPVLVTVDDVQWADQATMHAFRSLRHLLASYPLSWILAMARSPHPGVAEQLFDLLEDEGAAVIMLGPLDPAAQIALISDVLSAVPDTALVELAIGAAGNPFILSEAFGGLLDEDSITVADGRASLTSAQVSERIQILAADRLKGLSAGTRQFTETASLLGSSFRIEDVAEMLSQSPGALLGVLDEAVSAHILAPTPDGLAFQHEFVRQAVAQLLPNSIRQALHWQFGHMLLARGGSAVPAAQHLLNGARPGDAIALAGLDRAVAGSQQPALFLRREVACDARGMDPGAPQDLVGQQVADAGDPLLVHDAGLDRRAAAGRQRGEGVAGGDVRAGRGVIAELIGQPGERGHLRERYGGRDLAAEQHAMCSFWRSSPRTSRGCQARPRRGSRRR